jgi:hypothetical protein
MRSEMYKSASVKSGLAAAMLLLASGVAFAQTPAAAATPTVNLTAKSAITVLPDGTSVPMWGLFCNDAGSAGASCSLAKGAVAPPTAATATVYAVNSLVVDVNGYVERASVGGTSGLTAPTWNAVVGATTTDGTVTWTNVGLLANVLASSATWAPPLITVPYTANSATGVSTTSLTINLTNSLSFTPPGSTVATTVPTSLVIVGQLGGGLGSTPTRTASPDHSNAQSNVTWPIAGAAPTPGTPPTQLGRVQSFSSEVLVSGTPGTGQCASPCTLTWTALRPGTYLIESGTHPSIQGPMGLYGVLVVTSAPNGATAGTAYPAVGATLAVTYNSEVSLLLSEIDPLQNNAVNTAVNTAGFAETNVWSGLPGGCGNPLTASGTSNTAFNTCYPPAVNYTPLYYLFNGVAFDRTHAALSLFPASIGTAAAPVSGNVLVRLVNAGLRMHVPSIVGAQTGGVALTPGLGLIAEDGNRLPGVTRVQSEVFLAAGKTYDVLINAPAAPAAGATASALPVFDRELSLSGNATSRDAGMLAYIGVNGAGLPAVAAFGTGGSGAVARADTYNSRIPGRSVVVSDPAKGVIANDTNVYGVQVLAAPTAGTLTLNRNGTFTYIANASSGPDSFSYCANGTVTGTTCSSGITATVSLGVATLEAGACTSTTTNGVTTTTGICVNPDSYTSTIATSLMIRSPGVLANDSDSSGYPLTVSGATLASPLTLTLSGPGTGTVILEPNGGFNASVSAAGTYTFAYQAQNSQGIVSANTATVTLTFPNASNLTVSVVDGKDGTAIPDYRWIIEEDRTFYIDPNCTTNPPPTGCPTFGPVDATTGTAQVPTFGTNFHTSYMPVVATGCTGPLSCESGQAIAGTPVVCDIGDGVCRTTAVQQTQVDPRQVRLDPSKRYYISVLPGDAATPFQNANNSAACSNGASQPGAAHCGHGMGGAPIAAACIPTPPATTCTGTFAPLRVLTQPTPFPPSKLSVFVFEDDFPLNGEQDGGGGVDVLSPNEPGLGGFNITIMDDAGGPGDSTGQVDYDMFNQPLSNSLAGTIDPATNLDACPISSESRIGQVPKDPTQPVSATNPLVYDKTQTGIVGTIVTCPKYEADGKTLSPLAGQAVVANMMPGRYGVVATPAADRIARGEEWLQTNTLDGQKAHDSFLRIGEPSFFQEYGPAGFHVSIGFANPATINSRKADVCSGNDPFLPGQTNCINTVTGKVTTERMSRTPDERLYSSGSRASFAFTNCYVSLGDPDGEDFAFTKCNADGTFTLTGIPDGDWRVTTFDQWNDQLVDGLSTPVHLKSGGAANTINMGDIAANQWQANFFTRTFLDLNKDGVSSKTSSGTDAEPGLALVKTNVRFRDGSFSNRNNTDLNGYAAFNEEFPLFSWYVIETDVTRYKNTGTHVVYDAGGPADNSPACTDKTVPHAPCGSSSIADHLANTVEQVSLPVSPMNLRVPGAVYCASADCTGKSIASGASSSDPPSACTTSPATGITTCTTTLSTGRIDPPWVLTEGWQGFSGQNSFMEFGKAPYAPNENGGIRGHVVYASTRPYDDPQFGTQNVWEPLVPNVTINLYQESTAPDGSASLTLVDTTQTSSFDAWAQGFRSDGVPNMNCPGQFAAPTSGATGDIFFFSLYNQPAYLDYYNNVQHGAAGLTPLPNNAQFKCYDGMHNWNQVQPAPYDGMYQFPSVTSLDPVTGKPAGTNCKICVKNPTSATGVVTDPNYDPYRAGLPMLPRGKYVVEVVVPPGYELVKEEDKNILIGDNFIMPATIEFPGLGTSIYILPDQAEVGTAYNAANAQNSTLSLGRVQSLASHEGDTATVDTFWPCVGAQRTVPDYLSLFPGATEVAPFAGAIRNLCNRKEVTLDDQTSAQAEFLVFTSAHAAAHFTGVITDDFTSEFDPFSPQFGEKFAPPDLPVSIKDWTGNEISRVYADHWGAYNGLTYSTWEVNPPNPTGYSPTMMITCMNDPGSGSTPDPLYNPQYSNFCYEIPFMPGATQYMDTPVTPTSAFAGAGYNNPDCAYADATPAVGEVDGDGVGPWVAAAGDSHTLKIYALGKQTVYNNAYSGPSATTKPYDLKTVTRTYSFGTTAGTVALVGSDGVAHALRNVTWGDMYITGTVPTDVPACPIQQQAQYGGPTGGNVARCGELVITAASGKQSIDTVTVTIGGKAPTHVAATASIQSAIDAAYPGDMLMIDPATRATQSAAAIPAIHKELLLMWKPIRLQGVGAVSSVVNGNTHPAGKLDAWRREVNCLFGLAINGQPPSTLNPFDPASVYTCPAGPAVGSTLKTAKFSDTSTSLRFFSTSSYSPQIDRLPLEAVVGWDASQNGNMAELLQEPSLMGALEGAAITVLSKGLRFPAGSDPFGAAAGTAGAFPTGTTLLQGTTSATRGCGPSAGVLGNAYPNPFPSNFLCNPSSIDGLGVTNSSQGGGGIFVHGWGHNIQIANNRVQNNTGTLSGGINIGQGEYPPSYTVGGTNADPGSCQQFGFGQPPGTQQPYCFDLNVNMHHNAVTLNSSTGDELFSATPAGAGGVSICNGSDYYKFNYNWVCGNLSTGDGGGLAHIGFSYNGDIEHNTVLFNQSTNPTIATNGGGILVMGAPDVDPTCGITTDQDCVSTPPVGPADGAGPGLLINANLIMGNSADSGSGGGLRFQNINGTDVLTFPLAPNNWYGVTVTNNIIANNVAGWDGAGVSLQDALKVSIINNTIVSNDATASSGVLFNTFGAPLASSAGINCTNATATGSCPQVAGLVSVQNGANLTANLPSQVRCPVGNGNSSGNPQATNGACIKYSVPTLYNDVIWDNRAFYIGVGGLGTGTVNQQNVVALYEAFTTTPTQAPSQTVTGACVPAADTAPNYWDIGVRGDTGPGDHTGGLLAPLYTVLTDAVHYPGANNTNGNPTLLSQYCNGSRVPPELGSQGYQVPPGIADATVPNPIFNLTPAATVDEGNNWINMSWGPLSLSNPVTGVTLGNYSPGAGSSVIDYVPAASPTYAPAPNLDFFGTPRKQNNHVDAGAVEFVPGAAPVVAVTPSTLSFTAVAGATSAPQTLTLQNTGGGSATGITVLVSAPFARPVGGAGGTCNGVLTSGGSCTINVVFSPLSSAAGGSTFTGTVAIAASGGVTVSNSPVALSGTVVAATYTASVSPSTLAFGNWATGTTSNARTVTVTNTGNSPLAGGTRTFGGGTPQPFSRATVAQGGGGSCGATLAVGASCTIRVVFTPGASAAAFSRMLTIAYTGATVTAGSTGTPIVTLTGTGVSARATASFSPNPLTIILAGATPGAPAITDSNGTVTLTNASNVTTGASFTVTGVALNQAPGATLATGLFNVIAGSNTCAGATLVPGGTCTVGVRFRYTGTSGRPATRAGTLVFTDSAAGSPQAATLSGVAQ